MQRILACYDQFLNEQMEEWTMTEEKDTKRDQETKKKKSRQEVKT